MRSHALSIAVIIIMLIAPVYFFNEEIWLMFIIFVYPLVLAVIVSAVALYEKLSQNH